MSTLTGISGLLASSLLLAAGSAAAEQINPLKWITEKIAGPRIEVPMQRPPELKDIHIESVAIAPAEGPPCAQPLSAHIEQGFLQAGITVVDRNRLDKVLNEYKLQSSGMVDQDTAAKIGKMLGAQALMFTQVTRCDVANGKSQGYRNKDTGETYYSYSTQATIAGSVRVIALTTGQVLATQPFQAEADQSSPQGYPDGASTMEEAQKKALESVKKTLVPWTDTVAMEFHNDNECDMNVAYDYVKDKDFTRALEQSKTNIETCADQGVKPAILAKAHYNLGVMQMYFSNYEAAQTSFTEVDRIKSTKASKAALANCRRAKGYAEDLLAYKAAHPAKAVVASSAQTPNAGKANKSPKSPGPVFDAHTSGKVVADGPSVKEQLAELKDLCQNNLLTPAECTQRRDVILKRFDNR
jgi:curli biogenesis system outer membrane secretion channel CsgG